MLLEIPIYHRWIDVGKFKLCKGRREVYGASSWAPKVNAVQGKATAPDWHRDAQGCRLAKL
jgi:hypothetical protein